MSNISLQKRTKLNKVQNSIKNEFFSKYVSLVIQSKTTTNELNNKSSIFVNGIISLAREKVNNNILERGVIIMRNKDVREYAQKRNVKLWQIAAELNINDGNFSRKLRYELLEETKQQIYKIIDELAESNS